MFLSHQKYRYTLLHTFFLQYKLYFTILVRLLNSQYFFSIFLSLFPFSWKEKVHVWLRWRNSYRRKPQPTARLHWPTPSLRNSYWYSTVTLSVLHIFHVLFFLSDDINKPLTRIAMTLVLLIFCFASNYRRKPALFSITSHSWPKSKESTSSLWRSVKILDLNSLRSNSTELTWWSTTLSR